MNQSQLNVERIKAELLKQLNQRSFYGILGTHPKAAREDIETGFRNRVRDLAETGGGDFASVLKAYATLTSGYKKDYDQYLESYRHAVELAVETCDIEGVSIDKLVECMQPWATETKTNSLFMQPWATSSEKVMQPWATVK